MAQVAKSLYFFTLTVVILSVLLTAHREVVSAVSENRNSKRLFNTKPECLSIKLNPLKWSCCQSYQTNPCNPSSSCGAQTGLDRQKYLECCATDGIQSALKCF